MRIQYNFSLKDQASSIFLLIANTMFTLPFNFEAKDYCIVHWFWEMHVRDAEAHLATLCEG